MSRLAQVVEAHHQTVGRVVFQTILLPMEADVVAGLQVKDQVETSAIAGIKKAPTLQQRLRCGVALKLGIETRDRA